MSQELSKELVLTNPESSKPRFITVGRGREVSTSGLRVPLVVNYLLRKGDKKYVPIGELSSVFCGGNTIPGKKRVRANLSKITVAMARDYGQILISETEGKHNRTSAVKVLDPSVPGELQAAFEKIKRMTKRDKTIRDNYDLLFGTLCKFQEPETQQ